MDILNSPGIYAGIGSRSTPSDVLSIMNEIGSKLGQLDWTLRSGGASGADTAFELGCLRAGGRKEIFKSGDAKEWAFEEARKHIPANRPPFDYWKPYVRGLIARNMMQVLGHDGDQPAKLVMCWTMAKNQGGGTGYAIRCAEAHDIPVFNLIYDDVKRQICEILL